MGDMVGRTARILEALLFAAEGPLRIEQVLECVPELSRADVEAGLEELRAFYQETARGFTLVAIAGGYQLLTNAELSPWVEKYLAGRRRQRLSRAALEALAIVAYQQPVTRGDVECVRGVDCGGTLHTLLERKLVAIKGRSRAVGHPLLYVTTERFLEHFGISELQELPRLEEFAGLVSADEARDELRRSGLLAPGEIGTGAAAMTAAATEEVGPPGDGDVP